MKQTLLALSMVVLIGCNPGKQSDEDRRMMAAQDESAIRNLIINLHADLKKLYTSKMGDVDSVLAQYYVNDMYYVTFWGTTETLDSTKSRFKASIPRINDYDNSIENLSVKVYGDGGYAFFVLRQQYTTDGFRLDEYLPTTAIVEKVDGAWKIVHLQRSTDPETFQQYLAIQQRARPSGQKK
jgi:ketosteroid isomerase-like protein